MIKFVNLGSGSKGNATYFDVDGTRFLVDCGFTKIATKKRLTIIGRVIEDIKHVFVTHDHKDHAAPWIIKENLVANFSDLPLNIKSFPLSHDAPCVGYTITDKDNHKVAILTDTGCIDYDVVLPYLFDCSAILIETSYDVMMLVDSPYPTETQERIASTEGHLRAECAAEAVGAVAWPGLKYVVAMHLSSTCINDALARFEIESVVKDIKGCEVVISNQKVPTKMMVIL